MDTYALLQQEFLTKQFIENNKEIMFSDIQDNQRRNTKETSNYTRTVCSIGEFVLQRIYSNRGIPFPGQKQERNIAESDKTRVFEPV